MSIDWIAPVWKLALPRHTLKLVMLALADNADSETGECFPSVVHLAEKSCMTPRAVQKALRELELLGYIHSQRRRSPHNPELNITTIYTILPPDLFTQIPSRKKNYLPNRVHHPTEPHSGGVANDVREGGERRSPLTVMEPSVEPSGNVREKKAAGESQLSEAREKIATDLNLDPLTAWAEFTDYHAQRDKPPRDIDAAWRGWCRKRSVLSKAGRLGKGVHTPETRKLSEDQEWHRTRQRAEHHLGGAYPYAGPKEGETLDQYRERINDEISHQQNAQRFIRRDAKPAPVDASIRSLAASKRVNQ